MGSERHFRAFGRRAVNLSASIATADGSRPARLLNVGLGGACVEIEDIRALSVGSEVTLELTASNLWDPLSVAGRIAWIHMAGPGAGRAGLTFRHAGGQALPALVELMSGSDG